MITQDFLESGAAALLFATTFLAGGFLHPLRRVVPDIRSVVSFSAGAALAFIFVHVMPELSEAREALVGSASAIARFDGIAIYLAAFAGFLLFYSLDHFSRRIRTEVERGAPAPDFEPRVIGAAAYVVLISYLLVSKVEDAGPATVLYVVAMAVHFLTLDHEFREQRGQKYARRGVFLLAGASIAGWVLGLVIRLPPDILGLMLGFLSGGIIVNGVLAELPADKEGRLLPFLAGGIAYSLLLIPFE